MLREGLTGLVLSGGRGRRMGGMDKGLVPYQGRALVLYALDALKCHADYILINANRNMEAYRDFGYPVVSDPDPDFRGPLSGILAGMRAAPTHWMLTVPCDMPKVDGQILSRLLMTQECTDVSLLIAHDGERLQPLLMLASTDLEASLHHYLDSGKRRVDEWIETIPHHIVDLSDSRPALVNLNDFDTLDKNPSECHD